MNSGISRQLNVAVIGAGYVGLTTGVVLAFLGHRVCAVDSDEKKISQLKRGESPIHEHGIELLMHEASDRLTFTCNTEFAVHDSDIVLIAVGTPSREDGQADTQYVEAAAREIAQHLLPGRSYVVVVKSTVPVGSNRRVQRVINEACLARGIGDDVQIHVVSNPEFLREGTALHDTLYPDRIVVGAERAEAADLIGQLYRSISEQTFEPPSELPRPEAYALPSTVTTDPASAELIKYASNAFLAMKISYINEIAGLCERVGADITEVARGMGLDSRISPQFLRAGLGWGGSCFPKDTRALVAMGDELMSPMRLVEATRVVNEAQRLRVVERLQDKLKGLRGRVIGILGLAFKPGTDDLRDSPALDVIRQLLSREAHVRAHDPIASEVAREALSSGSIKFCKDAEAVAEEADAIILCTEWPEYRNLNLFELAAAMKHPIFFDTRNMFARRDAEAAGLLYLGIGR